MIYRKLEFPANFDWRPLMPADAIVYDLGHIIVASEVLDPEGEVITEPMLSDGYCVDVMCQKIPEELTPYIVWPSGIGMHIPMGWEEYYRNESLNLQP